MGANMIGVLKRIIVIDLQENGTRKPFAFINPEIIWRSEEMQTFQEASLCFPGISANIMRPNAIKVRYLDIDGNPQELEAKGYFATVIQHEIDYLDGKVFLDYLSPLKRNALLKKMQKHMIRYLLFFLVIIVTVGICLQNVGGGVVLQRLQKMLAQVGIPVVGLPTVNYSVVNQQKSVNFEMAQQAVMMLWYLVGLGFQLVLPIRDRHLHGFIISELELSSLIEEKILTANREPSFLGGVKKSLRNPESRITHHAGRDISLLEYYFNRIAELNKFIRQWNRFDPEQRQMLVDNLSDTQFQLAFIHGQENKENPNCLEISMDDLEALLNVIQYNFR